MNLIVIRQAVVTAKRALLTFVLAAGCGIVKEFTVKLQEV